MENNVKVAENFEEAAATAAEMIDAGKDVLVDMSQEGKFNVSEIVKPSWFATYGPVVGFGAGCAVAGGLIGYGISKVVAKCKAKKEAAEVEKAFADKEAKQEDTDETVEGEIVNEPEQAEEKAEKAETKKEDDTKKK